MAVPKQRKTETMSVSESRKQYSEVLNRVYRDEERVIVEKSGIPIGAIVSIEDVFSRTQSGFRGIPPDALEQQIEQAIEEVEADYREKRESKRNAEPEHLSLSLT